MLNDVRLAVRSLKQTPRLAAFAIVSVALGIGINTTVFSFVNALQFRPLPYADPNRLVNLHEESATELCQGCSVGTSYPGYLEWAAEARSYEQVAAYTGESFVVSGRGEPERIDGAMASASFFTVLGVQPAIGRALLPDNDRAGSEPVVVLSDGLWRRLFAADRAAVGGTLRINGRVHTVVGVMPPMFGLPEFAKLWVALTPNVRDWPRTNRMLSVVARLRGDGTLATAASELRTIAARQAQANPSTNARWTAGVISLHDELDNETVPVSAVLMGAVMLVLLIACANLASLLLVRAANRQREMAVRAALGASRLRLARQLVIESLLLSVFGGAAGLAIASWSHDLLPRLLQTEIPQWIDFSFDWRVLLGADAADIRTQMLSHGVRFAVIGIFIGLAGAAGVTRVLRGVLVGTSPTDPAVFVSVPFVLVAIAVAAAYLPVRRATRIDPLIALRRT